MPVSFSCRRTSWLQSRVQTRGEEEQVNVEGRFWRKSGQRQDRAQRKAAAGMHKIKLCPDSVQMSDYEFCFLIFFFGGGGVISGTSGEISQVPKVMWGFAVKMRHSWGWWVGHVLFFLAADATMIPFSSL